MLEALAGALGVLILWSLAACALALIAGAFIAAGGVHHHEVLKAGQIRLRLSGRQAHRIELHDGPCWTLFITGPRYRHWGFQRFTAAHDIGAIGPGCEG